MAVQIQNVAVDAVYDYLDSRVGGLEDREVLERRREVGANVLTAPRPMWWAGSLVRQFANFFTILLDISAVICFVADQIQPGQNMNILGWALLGVSVLNALFSFAQEYRAERAMDELRKLLPQKVTVRRGGVEAEVLAADLVPGDVLLLREGDRVAADARLVESSDLLVNNAPLTGESLPVPLRPAPTEASLTESGNLAFAGCTVLRGVGLGVVFATGLRTEFGRIAALSQGVQRTVSPLERETAHMVRVLTVIAVFMGVAFFAWGVYAGRSLWVNLVFMMGIIVANVPEGLLPTFTLSLAMGSLRMARRNVLVKSLNAVETLGAVHVICSDKTGTLTENRLAIVTLADPHGTALPPEGAARCLELALVASDVREGGQGLTGDPLDVSVAALYGERIGAVAPVMERIERHFEFDAEKRRAAGVARSGDGASMVFAVKGAWESLKPLIAYIESARGGARRPADPAAMDSCEGAVRELAGRGERVIAVAYRRIGDGVEADAEQTELERDLSLLGFLGVEDPLRAEVPEAMARCHGAGIDVIMITGDHPDTAVAIARKAGLIEDAADPGAVTVTGAELGGMRQRELIHRLERGVAVFARTTPEQKMKIVTALQRMHRVVAVTGDGVNDAPALKSADVGIAMGRGGTDVARETAQVILLDDNFASIVSGVEEGRTIFANIRKFTNYVLVSNGPEILPFLIYILFPVPLALTVIQILCIDLGTDIIPSMGLGQEPPDPNVMTEPPRGGEKGLMSLSLIVHSYFFLGLIEAVFSLGLFFWVLKTGGWQYGQDLAPDDLLYRSATGITLSSILLMQIGNLFGRRSPRHLGVDRSAFNNRLIVAGVLIEVFFSWAVLYWPPISGVLGTGSVPYRVYWTAWLGVPLILGLDYVRKLVACRLERHGREAEPSGA